MDLTPEAVEQLINEAEAALGDEPRAGDVIALVQARHVRAERLVVRAHIALVRVLLAEGDARYQAGREDAARDIAEAIERANDAGAWAGVEQPGPAVLAYDHAAGLARMYRVPDCGDQYHGADGGACSRCGFDVADQGDQPRTVEEAVGDNPEGQRP